ncbi:MAG: PAS domain S-box protein [Bacteroidetes bacterium]|nr:PAS domain S-box protein [Bacteroidota bacterium]
MLEQDGDSTRTQAEAVNGRIALAERDFYHGLYNAATDLIIVIDTEKRTVVETNRATRETLGYSEEALRDAECLELFSTDDTEIVCAHISRPEENGTLLQATLRTREGQFLPVEISIVHFELHGRALCATLCRDITERRAFEQELIEAREAAERSNRLKSVFLASMSHELRTPMNAILGFSELLCEELVDAPQHRMAEIINTSGHRLLETLNSILDLSLIEADRMEVIPEQVSVTSLAEEVCLLFKPLAKRKGLRLECLAEETDLQLRTDPRLLRQIMNNLVSNAIKFTTQGYVHLLTRLEIIDRQPNVRIEVIDTGIGISQENLTMIFEEFRQVSEGYGRRFDGSGLGLAITQRFTELLGGSISVESNPGKGSRFILLIPHITVSEYPA